MKKQKIELPFGLKAHVWEVEEKYDNGDVVKFNCFKIKEGQTVICDYERIVEKNGQKVRSIWRG